MALLVLVLFLGGCSRSGREATSAREVSTSNLDEKPAETKASHSPARGPLRVHPKNPRYFTDGSGKAVYLTGSHTWANLIDRGPKDPPSAFDFDGYLDFLHKHHHNFIRLWGRHVSWYHDYGEGQLHAAPLAWSRTGPGNALDGKPRFDLSKFNPAYFDRLRARVVAARDRGIYVGIMLFGGIYECRGGWRGNPFNARNNINGVDGDPKRDGTGLATQTLQIPAITRLQEAYVRRVIDTVNDLENVLYEISNESDGSSESEKWQHHLIRLIHDHEARKPKQHPVGMTATYWPPDENRARLDASPAAWVSYLLEMKPSKGQEGFNINDPFVADGRKVSLLDSDHWWIVPIYGNARFGRDWVWKGFCRGHNTLLMEHLPPRSMILKDHPLTPDDPGYIASRTAMGQTRRFAERMDLASMTPRNDLASTRYCLANAGAEYLVYVPDGDAITVDLSAGRGDFAVEWHDPSTGKATKAEKVARGARRGFKAPFDGAAVLYLVRAAARE